MPIRPGMCACGEPLHYLEESSRKTMETLVAEHGETILVRTPEGSWLVPRHYIALHGIATMELPGLAKRYGFEKVS